MPPEGYEPRDRRYWPIYSNDGYDWQMVFALREIADELRAIRVILANPPHIVDKLDNYRKPPGLQGASNAE